MKIGQGFDVHLFGEGRSLILGGVTIPFERGLEGHSDGDALLHAVIDAILGALSLGDIGTHFPPGDDRWKDVSSTLLLERVVSLMQGEGYSLSNLDSTIIADEPFLSPWIPGMRTEIAIVFGVDAGRVSVKAKSFEGLSTMLPRPIIAASAVASLERE